MVATIPTDSPQVPPPRDAAKYDEAMRRPGVGVAAGTARGNGDRVDKCRTPNLGRGFAKSVKFRFKLLRHGLAFITTL